MEYNQERISSIKGEIQPLIENHWSEIAINQDNIKLNPDWDTYYKLESLGMIKLYTARADGKLVGYFTVVVTKGLHYIDHLFAATDVIYIAPEYRKGRAGYGLIKTKDHAPFDKLLESMDYNLAERLYQKFIG
jgi:hypothetical protein